MTALIVGRVIAGIGGAGMYLGNLNLITINTSLRERPIYMGGLGLVWGMLQFCSFSNGVAGCRDLEVDSKACSSTIPIILKCPLLILLSIGLGTILGPVIGGSFADSSATWRWAFYLNLVLFAIIGPALLMIPPFDPQPGLKFFAKIKQIDWVGAVLNAGLYVSFVLALTFGGTTVSEKLIDPVYYLVLGSERC